MRKDEKKLLGEKTIAGSMSLESMLSKFTIPPIPANRLQLLEVIRQPTSRIDVNLLIKLMAADPALFAMTMKLANSSYYRAIDPIISLRSAITRIGLSDTVDAVSFFCIRSSLPAFPSFKAFSSESYWTFSWACAMAARRLGHPNLGMNVLPGELYMAGLLHGIGKLLMAIHHPDKFEKCIARSKKMKQPLYKIEQEIFGTVNGFLASKTMKFWNFPDNICAGVAFYQMPELAPPEHRVIAGLIQFAFEITSETQMGCSGEGYREELTSTYIGRQSHLSLSKETIQKNLIQEIQQTLEEKFEGVAGRPYTKEITETGKNIHKQIEPATDFPAKPPHNGQRHSGLFPRLYSFFRKWPFKFNG